MADPIIKIKVEGSGLPAGGADGQVLTRQGGKAVWSDLPKGLAEEDVLKLLISLGVAPVLTDADGAVLADGDGAILITA